MAAANWVCVALVISLGFAMCSADERALFNMNHESSISVTQQDNMPMQAGHPGIVVEDDFGGPICSLVESCNPNSIKGGTGCGGCDMGDLAQLRNIVTQLAITIGQISGNHHLLDAMAPEPASG